MHETLPVLAAMVAALPIWYLAYRLTQWLYAPWVLDSIDWSGPLTQRWPLKFVEGQWVPLTGGTLIAEAYGPGSHDLIAGLRDEVECDEEQTP